MIHKYFKKVKEIFEVSWIETIYFNFKYLPFKQAIKLPIFLYKPTLLLCKGTILINCEQIRTGMVRLGQFSVSLYPKDGIVWENHGGLVTFNGNCLIGNSSAISIGKTGSITFGKNFLASSNVKIVSYCEIVFSENVRVAWETIIMDTSFHPLKDKNGGFRGNVYAPIFIGKNNWIPVRCMVFKGTKTPDFCVFGAGSILNNDYSQNPTHILMAGNPLTIKVRDIWRDTDDDSVDYKKVTH